MNGSNGSLKGVANDDIGTEQRKQPMSNGQEVPAAPDVSDDTNKPWWKRWWGITGIVLVVLIALSGVANEDTEPTVSSSPTVTATSAPTPTSTPTEPELMTVVEWTDPLDVEGFLEGFAARAPDDYDGSISDDELVSAGHLSCELSHGRVHGSRPDVSEQLEDRLEYENDFGYSLADAVSNAASGTLCEKETVESSEEVPSLESAPTPTPTPTPEPEPTPTSLSAHVPDDEYDPELDALADRCVDDGDVDACDDLFWESPLDSTYEAIGLDGSSANSAAGNDVVEDVSLQIAWDSLNDEQRTAACTAWDVDPDQALADFLDSADFDPDRVRNFFDEQCS